MDGTTFPGKLRSIVNPSGWTPGRLELAERMWGEGYSARAVAEACGGGLTRSAVLGKAHRNNWLRGSEAPPVEVAPLPPTPPSDPVPVNAEKWMCRWETEEPGRFGLHICGNTTQPGRNYCHVHITKAYEASGRRKRAGTVEGTPSGRSSLA